jgi:hypothetical protein
MANFLKKAVGEISKLRQNIFSSLGWRIIGGSYGAPYRLDSSRVDYAKARRLYKNTDDDYKLGAGFAKPVINTTAGFMGVPHFRSEDEDVQAALDNFFGDNVSRMQQAHRDALRDGDAFVWITREEEEDTELYPEGGARLMFNIIPPEQVTKINRNPVTGRPREYILKSEHTWEDENGEKRKATIVQRLSKDRRIVLIEGDVPPDLVPGEEVNPWGFIPIVHFRNEGDATEEFGTSDLEAIEPFMKAYHDVMLHAIQGSKMHSTPRLKLKLQDVAGFLANNFGVDDSAKFARDGGTINLDGHEMLIFQDEEDASFIEVSSAIGAASDLLKFLFYCIVDTSETPEFSFGVHTPSSLSSVQEQMPILIRRIARKREHFSETWQHLARIVLAMTAKAEGRRFSTHATTISWDKIDPRDGKDIAQELFYVTQSLNMALMGGFISLDAAAEFLGQYIDTMNDFISDNPEIIGERDRIMRTRLMNMRLEDSQFLEKQKKEIDKELFEEDQ